MKKQILKFDQFFVWIFEMGKGETKSLPLQELTRNLPMPTHLANELLSVDSPLPEPRHHNLHAVKALNAISLFVKGVFLTDRGSEPPFKSMAGEGAYRYVYSRNTTLHRIASLQDGSEYHCILPRDHTPRFWERKLYKLERNQIVDLPGLDESFIYLAAGSIDINNTRVDAPMLVKTKNETQRITINQNAIFVRLWVND